MFLIEASEICCKSVPCAETSSMKPTNWDLKDPFLLSGGKRARRSVKIVVFRRGDGCFDSQRYLLKVVYL